MAISQAAGAANNVVPEPKGDTHQERFGFSTLRHWINNSYPFVVPPFVVSPSPAPRQG